MPRSHPSRPPSPSDGGSDVVGGSVVVGSVVGGCSTRPGPGVSSPVVGFVAGGVVVVTGGLDWVGLPGPDGGGVDVLGGVAGDVVDPLWAVGRVGHVQFQSGTFELADAEPSVAERCTGFRS